MLKYASKFFLEIVFSVVATIVGSLIANHYIPQKPAADAPVTVAAATVDARATDIAAAPEAAKADVTASTATVDVINAPEPSATTAGPVVDKTANGKASPPADEPTEPTNVPARPLQPVPRARPLSKASMIPARQTAVAPVVSRDLGRANAERFYNANAMLLPDPPPQETYRYSEILPPPPCRPVRRSPLGRVFRPIVHAAWSLLTPPPAPVGRDSWNTNDGLSAPRPGAKKPTQWP
jgi:hypothetical protein